MTANTDSLVVADTTAPLDFFKKHGYYQVGNRVFNYRVRALQEATRTNQSVQWVFNNDIFSSLDWQAPLRLSMDEIYRIRAQQLREKYDYLLLYFSGGADSTVILQSFINNNIKLDEIVVGWPLSQSAGKYTPNTVDTSARNMMSEWDFSIKPKLDQLAQSHPEIRITICDILQDPKNNHFNENTVTLVDNHSFIGVNRNKELDQVLEERTKKYPSIAGIVGIAPLEVLIADDNYLITYFFDTLTSGVLKNDYPINQYPRNIEFFFWSPDMPEIVREQGHAILDYININPASRNLIPRVKMKNRGFEYVHRPDSEAFRLLRKSIIYPSWKESFQVDKPGDQIGFSAWQCWWHDNEHSKEFVSSWTSAIESELALIDQKFFQVRDSYEKQHNLLDVSLKHRPSNSSVVHYQPLISKYYLIGRLLPV
jgi:hypothetical protein